MLVPAGRGTSASAPRIPVKNAYMAPGQDRQSCIAPVQAGNLSGSNRLTRAMRSQLPPFQPVPERAWPARRRFDACTISRILPLADTNARVRAMDCPTLFHPSASDGRGHAGYGTALAMSQDNSEHARAATAYPAGTRRAWRSHNGNAHAHRCAPPGRNPGGGTQGKPD